MGEKDVVFKNTLWEEATRIPFILYDPELRAENKICNTPVSLIDLYPTLNDLCELPKEPNCKGNNIPLDGFSLKPLLENSEDGQWNGPEAVNINICTNKTTIQEYGTDKGDPLHFSRRSQEWRYNLYANGEEELYDHKTDPNELRNLATKEEFKNNKAKLKSELLESIPIPFKTERKKNYSEQGWDISDS